MVSCEICGRQVKTAQALRGHKTIVHGMGKCADTIPLQSKLSQNISPWQDTYGAELSERKMLEEKLADLETRLEELEEEQTSFEASLQDTLAQKEDEITVKAKNEVECSLKQLVWDLLMKQLGPIQSRLGSLEAEQSNLKIQLDSLKRDTVLIDRRLVRLETPVCVTRK